MEKRNDTEIATAKALNELARQGMILRLLNDIRIDLTICEIEGWDKTEYIRTLQDELNRFEVKR